MSVLVNVLAFLIGLIGMEWVAWATHKYIMHGLLWSLHKDHHMPHKNKFERNDWFAVIFASPAIILMVFSGGVDTFLFWMGAGITAYGMSYFIFHDVIVHRRVKVGWWPDTGYMRRIIRAHKIHHRTLTKEGAEAFGFLFASQKYNAAKGQKRKSELKNF
jgi:beta-carotene 3-hydroxylase